jgi:hypothetical protein
MLNKELRLESEEESWGNAELKADLDFLKQTQSGSAVTRAIDSSAWIHHGESQRVSTIAFVAVLRVKLSCQRFVSHLSIITTGSETDMNAKLADWLWLKQKDTPPNAFWPQGLPRQQHPRR